jgi:hypothetical protein
VRRIENRIRRLPDVREESLLPSSYDLEREGARSESELVAPLVKRNELIEAEHGQLFKIDEALGAVINIGRGDTEALTLRPIDQDEAQP